MKEIALILTVSLLLGTLTACQSKKKRYEAQFLTLFDTVTTLVAYTNDKKTFTAQAWFIHNRLEEYHRLFDIYKTYDGMNNLKTVNDNAGVAPVLVDRRILDLLKFAREMERKTDGAVNVAMGSVLSVWHDYREHGIDDPERGELPPLETLREAALHTEPRRVVIDEMASTVFLEDSKMSLDVGAVAKGYAVEQVCRQAEARGFTAGLVSVGGNVRAIGARDGRGTPWTVGIQNPWQARDEKKLLGTVGLLDDSLVTSGVYQRYYTVAGKRYHHIIAPDTLMPADRFEAVTILCADSGEADALSTAAFNMTLEEGMALIASLPEAEAMWVYPDGALKYSAGFSSRFVGGAPDA